MKILNVKDTAKDSVLLAAVTILPLPILIMGISPIILLFWCMMISFLYSLLKKRTKKQLIAVAIVWPLLTTLVSLVLADLLMVSSTQILTFWFSLPGFIMYVGMLSAFLLAQTLSGKLFVDEEGIVS